MISDDTEHTLFVAQALLAHPNDPAAFQRCLAWKLRLWLLGLPAGIGFATLRSILIPFEWLNDICEWPCTIQLLEQIAERLARQKEAGRPLGPVRYFWPGLIPRSFIFVLAVLLNAFRRLQA